TVRAPYTSRRNESPTAVLYRPPCTESCTERDSAAPSRACSPSVSPSSPSRPALPSAPFGLRSLIEHILLLFETCVLPFGPWSRCGLVGRRHCQVTKWLAPDNERA